MTDTSTRRVLSACAVLAAAALTGFLVRHFQPAPDAAATAPWATVCHGRDGHDLHRLLGGGPTVSAVWDASDLPSTFDIQAIQMCTVSVGNAFMSIRADLLDPSDLRLHPEDLIAPTPHAERFTAGDGGLVFSKQAISLVTCRDPGSALSFRAEIRMEIDGTAAHRPDRRHLMENIVRAWADDLEKAKNCDWPTPPLPSYPQKDPT